MTLAKKVFSIASLALVFNVNLMAHVYTIQNKTLKEALQIIASQSDLSYAGESALLESKKANDIKNVEGLEKALEQLLKGTGLEAVIKDKTIILKKEGSNIENLKEVSLIENADTENSGSYTLDSTNTAIGLDLSLRQTPQSVSIMSNQLIQDLSLNDVDEALQYTPGINMNTDTGRTRIQSRGFYIDNIQEDGIASSVASSVQGPLAFSKESTDLAFYDRVEVLRGVAGLTQSNGEPGGTINLVRKKPTHDFQVLGSVSAGSWGNYRKTIDLAGPLNDEKTIRNRFIGVVEKTGSYKDGIDGDRIAIGDIVEIDVTDTTLLSIGMIYQKSTGVYDVYGVPVLDLLGNNLNLKRDSYFGADWNKEEYEKTNAFAELKQSINDDWIVSGNLNYTHSDALIRFGALGGTSRYDEASNTHTVRRQQYENTSDELGLKLGLDGKYELFGQTHDLFINGSISREKFSEHDKWASSLTGYSIYNFNASSILEPNWNDNSSLTTDAKYNSTIDQKALTLGTRYNFTDTWHLIVGGRESKVEYERDSYNYKTSTASRNDPLSTKKFVPYAGLTWDFAQNHSWYASYAEIFKPQNTKDMNGKYLDPVIGSNYETGIKSEYFGGKLNTTLSLFEVVQENRAMTDPLNTSYSIADGRIRSRGVDVEISGALNDQTQIMAGYTHNINKYMKTERILTSSTSVDRTKGATANTYTPEHMFRLYVMYKIPSFSQLSIGSGIRYQSETSGFYRNTMSYVAPEQGGYTLWDANMNYEINKHLNANLVIKNITDKTYFYNTQNRTAGMNNYYGEPRNLMLTLNYKY